MSDQSSGDSSWWFRGRGNSSPLRDRLRGIIPRLKSRAQDRMPSLNGGALDERLEAIDPEFVAEGAREVTDTDVEMVVEKADAIEERFRDNGPLRRLIDDGQLLLALVQDTWKGQYQNVPWWTLSGAAFALLYVLNPLDLIPDALPIVGVLDDAAVISACLVLLEQDLYDYRRWQREVSGGSETATLPES